MHRRKNARKKGRMDASEDAMNKRKKGCKEWRMEERKYAKTEESKKGELLEKRVQERNHAEKKRCKDARKNEEDAMKKGCNHQSGLGSKDARKEEYLERMI